MENNVLYLCDERACKKCSSPNCRHTFQIEHAKNFKKEKEFDIYWEMETPEPSETTIEPPREVVIIRSKTFLTLDAILERAKLYAEMIREHEILILAPGDTLVGVEHLSSGDSLIEMSE